MRTIYKYPLQLVDEQTIEMPSMAVMLHVAMQNDVPCLWALVDNQNPKTMRSIRIVGTGHNANKVARYIGTFQMAEGALVWHVFERNPFQ